MKGVFVFLATSLSLMAYGQTDTTGVVLTFPDAVKMALEKNIELNKIENELERAKALRTQAMVQMLPSVGVNGDLYARKGRQQIQNPETNQVDFVDVVSNNFGASLNASMPLFNGMNRIQTFRAGVSNLQAQVYGVERSKQTTIFNVAQQYLQVLLSFELYQIAKDNLRNQSENLRQIQERVNLGSLAPVDHYNQLAEVRRLESVAIRALNTYETDKLILAQIIQLDPSTDFAVESPNFSIEQVVQMHADPDALFETAMSTRSDFKEQNARVESSQRMVRALRGSYLPSVSAFYNYGSSYNSMISFSKTDQFRSINPYHFYGISFNIPILNGFSTHTRVQQAKIDVQNRKLDEENLKVTIYREVKTACLNFETAKATYEFSLQQEEAATEAHNLESERYRLGVSSFYEFSQANNALVLAQASRAQAAYTLMFQEILLNYHVGKLKF
jgi:outer membrane protein